MKAVILAAGIGRRLQVLTQNPKCLLPIGGKTLLSRYLDNLEHVGISHVTIVVGYKEAVSYTHLTLPTNREV